jgi:hypothetical protein
MGLAPGDRPNLTTNEFSEWNIRMSHHRGNRSFLITARPLGEGSATFPEIRAMFTSASGLTLLRTRKTVRARFVPDNPCVPEATPTARGNQRKIVEVDSRGMNKKKVAGKLQESSEREFMVVGLGMAAVIVFVIFLWRRNRHRRTAGRPKDIENLLDRKDHGVEGEGDLL